MNQSTEMDFKIGSWWVRPQLGELRQGDSVVRLEARSVEVLACLARHAPKVVSKEQILEEVWGDTFVGDEVISHAIWDLRRALEDDAREPRYIQTLPRKGYRLIADVVSTSGATTPRPGAQIGRYEILEELGAGAMGVVYRARDLHLHREVALKFLAPELTRDASARQRFLREARLAASLDHPNLATVHEIGETAEGHQYIVAAYYSGGSLKERLGREPLTRTEALSIGLQVARGLAEAHRHGIIHRDVKPANIFLADNGMAKIGDFGIAKLEGATRLTRTGTHLGTPAYKSPEQTRGEEVDQRTDVWSLGIVLYEMLSGRLPFRGDYEHAVVHSILEDEPVPLGSEEGPVHPGLEAVVQKALDKDPAARYPTADDLVTALQEVSQHPQVAATRPAAGSRKIRLRPLAVGAGAVLLLVALVGWMTHSRVDSKPVDPVAVQVDGFVKQGTQLERNGDSLEDLGAAIQNFDNALELRPGDPFLQSRMALALARVQAQRPTSDRLAKIRSLVESAVTSAPDSWWSFVARAKLASLERDWESARDAARKAIERTPPGDPEADRGYTLLGEALIRLGQVDEGLDAIRKGVGLGFGQIRARLFLAYELWSQGDLDHAAAEYAEILRDYDRNRMEALTNLGILYNVMGRYSDALTQIKRSWDRRKDPRTANNLGAVYFNLGRWEEAIGAFHDSINLDPAFPNPYDGLGDTYRVLDRPEEANHWYEEALVRYRKLAESGGAQPRHWGQLAVCMAKLGRFDEARQRIETTLSEVSGTSTLSFYAAQIYALAGDRKKLFETLREAVNDLYSLDVFRRDPSFAAFQDDPEFQAILEGDSATPPNRPPHR